MSCLQTVNMLTWMMKRMHTQPEVAMILAELGMRMKSGGKTTSAQRSSLLPSCCAK